ncbi:hypothetical protein ScPMuIL_016046 [Solemya velum]
MLRNSAFPLRCLLFQGKSSSPQGRWHMHRLTTDSSSTCSNQGPLSGIRILDLTRVLAGPYCTMILGDLGAEVLKVERPGSGDDTRTWGPPFRGSESAYFLSVNRNKKSIAINMKSKQGQSLVKQLANRSDVLIENYIPGKLEKLGLGYNQMKSLAPHLIYCSITGYGQAGPHAMRAGYDVIVAGVGGLTHITGPEDGEPCKVGVAMTDLSTGLYAYGSILAALLHRQKSGRGQHIDCNLLSTQVASLVNIGSNYLNADMEARRYGTAHQSIVPYQAFKTSDGYILVGAGNDQQFNVLCKLLALEELSSDEKYTTNQLRVANRRTLLAKLSERFAHQNTDHWLAVFETSGIPYGPINNMQQVFSDPQVIHRGMVQEMEHPTAGHIRLPGPAVKFSESDTVLQSPPPTLGQHTDEVLKDLLGVEDDQLTGFRETGVIQ